VPRLPELRIDQRLQLMSDLAVADDADEHILPDLAFYGIRSLTSPRRAAYAARRPAEFGVGVVGRYSPRRNGDHSLICFACFIE
jgi:hypothetical protein